MKASVFSSFLCALLLANMQAVAALVTDTHIHAGSSGGEQITTTLIYNETPPPGIFPYWELPSASYEVAHSDAYGPWIKEIPLENFPRFDPEDQTPGPRDDIVIVKETFEISGAAWTDWHEQILTPDWVFIWWIPTKVGATDPGDWEVETRSIFVQIGGETYTQGLELFFDPLPAGTLLETWRGVAYLGDEPFTGTLQIAQYPTIPVPGTLPLLGLGAVAFAFGRIRRRQLNQRSE